MFIIEGRQKLAGTIQIGGSKNATLPILCAALLSKKPITLNNVPNISDVRELLHIFNSMGVKTTFNETQVTIDAADLTTQHVDETMIGKMRGSILLFGPVLARLGELNIPFPGGCVLGKRSVTSHTYAFECLGAQILQSDTRIHIKMQEHRAAAVLMPEMSVTASENAIMLAALTPGITKLKLVAAEPHVQDLCHFLNSLGAKIGGIGTHYLEIEGVTDLTGGEYTVTGDYLEAGTYAIAGLVTQGDLEINGIETAQLDPFWQKLTEMGAQFELKEHSFRVLPSPNLQATNLRTAVHPSFATDLQAPFSVLMTQANGESTIFETLFEGRLNYLFELEKMGAKIQMLNTHQAKITGPTKLKGVPIASIDIRAGAAMVLAALAAEGTTQISNVNYIDRGYENIEGKLTAVGAKISRI